MSVFVWYSITAVVFTIFGYYVGSKVAIEDIVSDTIDSLIEDGYLKTAEDDDNVELIKWRDW